VTGRALPLRGNDIDTDRIIPARFLVAVSFEGLEKHVFEDDRKSAGGPYNRHPFDVSSFQGAAVLLTERTSNLSTHSGQVAFPGGRVDPEDANIAAAALREAWEEVGLSAQYIEVLGNLPTYTTVTSFIVTPVVALVQPDFELTINPYEVAEAFEVPLAWLMDPANHRHHTVPAPDGTRRQWYSMPYQDGADERFVWGATAGMLRNLYRFLSA